VKRDGRFRLGNGFTVRWTWYAGPLGPGVVMWRIGHTRNWLFGSRRCAEKNAEGVARRAAIRSLRSLHTKIRRALDAEGILL